MDIIDICTINFNTSDLTNNLLRSILKKMTSFQYRIIIFDNSNRNRFIISDDVKNEMNNKNIKYLYMDNTCQQLCNTDEMKKKYCKYPRYSVNRPEKNDFASARHTYTIDWLTKNLEHNFILFDSDTYLIKDIDFIDDDSVTIASIQPEARYCPSKRFQPYIQYFNISKIKENNLNYFDPEKMLGCNDESKGLWDTGASFYYDITQRNIKFKEIDNTNYIVHLAGGSWYANRGKFIDECEKWKIWYEYNNSFTYDIRREN